MVFVAGALIIATAPGGGGRLMAWLAAKRGIEFDLDWRGYLRLIGSEHGVLGMVGGHVPPLPPGLPGG